MVFIKPFQKIMLVKVFEATPQLVSLPKEKEHAVECMRNRRLTRRIDLGHFARATCLDLVRTLSREPLHYFRLCQTIFVTQTLGEENFIFLYSVISRQFTF